MVKVNAIIPEAMRDELHRFKDQHDVPVQAVVELALHFGLKCLGRLDGAALKIRLKRRKPRSK